MIGGGLVVDVDLSVFLVEQGNNRTENIRQKYKKERQKQVSHCLKKGRDENYMLDWCGVCAREQIIFHYKKLRFS